MVDPHHADMTTTTLARPAAPVRQPAVLAAIAGAVSAAVALGLSELLAGILPGSTSLVAAVGQVVIDLQPPGAKDLVVALFGTNDKLALEAVVAAAAIAIGAVLGVLARRTFVIAAIGFIAFGIVGFLAALGDPLANPAMVAASVALSVGVALQVLGSLLGRAALVGVEDAADGTASPARRSFLLRSVGFGVGAVIAGLGGRALLERGSTAPADAIDVPPASEVVAPLSPAQDLAPNVPGLTPIIVPNDSFYRIDTALLVPDVDVATWRLRIHGLVERETTRTFEELIGLPLFEQYVTIACVSNEVGGGLVGNARWTGVRLREVLAMAGVQAGATQLVGRSVD